MDRRVPAALLPAMLLPLMAAGMGGWATITVEDLPEHLVAGEAVELRYIVRQHGLEPLRGLKGIVEARAGSREARVSAVPGRRNGQYVATITLPEAGAWTLTIHSGFGRSSRTLLPIRVVDRAARVAAMAPVERGEHLFVAKGCLSCHTHGGVETEKGGDVGPDLTQPRLTADYLAKFLANPSIRPPTTPGKVMPNLELREPEIGALVAFLGQGGGERGQK